MVLFRYAWFMLLLGLPFVPVDLAWGNRRNLPRPGYVMILSGGKDSTAFRKSNVASVGSFGRQDALCQWKMGNILGHALVGA